jgi:hypothetical protein
MKQYKEIVLSHETDQVASHQPALIWAMENTSGDVLELGMGNCSTVLIHELLKGTNRKILSIEDSSDWMNKFIHLESTNHQFVSIERSVDSWKHKIDECSYFNWSVVFVDQGYGEEIWRPTRNYAVQKLVQCADFVVAHDADVFPEMKSSEYNWIEYVPTYKAEPNRNGPPTYIFSKKHSLKDIHILE